MSDFDSRTRLSFESKAPRAFVTVRSHVLWWRKRSAAPSPTLAGLLGRGLWPGESVRLCCKGAFPPTEACVAHTLRLLLPGSLSAWQEWHVIVDDGGKNESVHAGTKALCFGVMD